MTKNVKPKVVLSGYDLTIEDIVAIGIGDKHVELDSEALNRCQQSRDFLKEEIELKRIIYGVNTSFGPMCNKIINDDQTLSIAVPISIHVSDVLIRQNRLVGHVPNATRLQRRAPT